MKNVMIAMIVVALSSTMALADCSSGTCSRTPIRSLGTTVARTTGAIVTAPFKVVNKVAQNSKSRRTARYNARHCTNCQ